jgi:hypothetical protein
MDAAPLNVYPYAFQTGAESWAIEQVRFPGGVAAPRLQRLLTNCHDRPVTGIADHGIADRHSVSYGYGAPAIPGQQEKAR